MRLASDPVAITALALAVAGCVSVSNQLLSSEDRCFRVANVSAEVDDFPSWLFLGEVPPAGMEVCDPDGDCRPAGAEDTSLRVLVRGGDGMSDRDGHWEALGADSIRILTNGFYLHEGWVINATLEGGRMSGTADWFHDVGRTQPSVAFEAVSERCSEEQAQRHLARG